MGRVSMSTAAYEAEKTIRLMEELVADYKFLNRRLALICAGKPFTGF